jgi:hypothetical protein
MDAMDDGHGDVPFTLPRMGRAEGNQEAEECEFSSGTWTIKGRATCWIF